MLQYVSSDSHYSFLGVLDLSSRLATHGSTVLSQIVEHRLTEARWAAGVGAAHLVRCRGKLVQVRR